MKITVGGSSSMTITAKPYEPIKVESSLFIEKEVDDDADIEEVEEQYQEKVNKLLQKDLDKKITVVARKQNELRGKLASFVD
jgi:hypothetical protein